MRKICKSEKIPLSLQQAPTPTSKEEVRDAIYKAEDVREQLVADQYNKCAYCECIVTKQYNDVDHFRPKDKYYWLGHKWDNLLYSCDLCNRTYKNNHFPLVDESTRGNLAKEIPLIINPSIEEPLEHICYNRFMIVPREINGIVDKKGETTIRLFHLNDRKERPTLVNGREQLYESYKREIKKRALAEKIAQSDISEERIQWAREIMLCCDQTIAKMKSNHQEYSGMLIGDK